MSVSCIKDTVIISIDELISPVPPKNEAASFIVFSNDYYTADPNDTTSVCIDWNHPALDEMRKRAHLIGDIEWSPLNEVPKREGVFTAGKTYKGIPYSSVKELDKFIGQEVSFYTFLSAVKNPRSVLYTENVGQSPYHGKNCAAYYGSVCSMTVNFALGLERPYGTFMYGALPFIKRVTQQDLEHAAPGDIVYFLYGHVILITGIIKDSNGMIKYVDILECTGASAFNRRYTREVFQSRLDKYEHVLYRYTDLQELVNQSFENQAVTDLSFNRSFSLSRGDKASFSEEESVVTFNILEDGFSRMEVYCSSDEGDILERSLPISGLMDVELVGLTAGRYKAVLVRDDGTVSDAISFEFLQTEVSSSINDGYLDIRFHSNNAIPEYIVFCNQNGGRRLIADISDDERMSGHKIIKCEASLKSVYLKVFFKGEYGRVSNRMIPLQ